MPSWIPLGGSSHFQTAFSWLINGGDRNYILTGMIQWIPGGNVEILRFSSVDNAVLSTTPVILASDGRHER